MNITYNEVVETLALAIAKREDYRAVMECVNNETILIDFSACGDPFEDGIVCSWSHQSHDINIDEIGYGSMKSYDDVFSFVLDKANSIGVELYVESF